MTDDQDKLAQEWADALLDGDGASSDSDNPFEGLDNVTDPSDAGSADIGQDDEALADEWAAALADTEQEEIKREKEQAFLSTQTHDYELTDMGADARPAALLANAIWISFWTFRWKFLQNWAAPSCSSTNCCSSARGLSWN